MGVFLGFLVSSKIILVGGLFILQMPLILDVCVQRAFNVPVPDAPRPLTR